MWFAFPKGCAGISVELHQYASEATDDNGVDYFRAPEHFAPRILALPGFEAKSPPEGCSALADLPKADPVRDNAIGELTATVSAQKLEIQALREDAKAATARVVALSNDNSDLKRKIETLEKVNADLSGEIEDKGTDVVPLKRALK